MEVGLRPPKLTVGNINVRRDFTDVRDVVRAYAALLEKGRTGQIYNISSGVGTLLADIVKQFQEVCRAEVAVETDAARQRPGETLQVIGDSTKIRKETGWNPQIPMGQTIRDLMDYWRKKVTTSGAVAL
jgi:GDP-4-dehydro-6-deoxy-D-mannose reductase